MSDIFRVLFTDEAEQDIEDIHAYIAEHGSLDAADPLIALLHDRIDALERFPYRGPVPHELVPCGFTDFRQIVAGLYRLIYQVVEQQVIVTLVVDGRREVAPILVERTLRQPPN